MNSNAFSAADMSTAAANGHRDGYQAGYADAVKAFDAAQPAAAQEAAWNKTKPTAEGAYYVRGFNLFQLAQYEALVQVRTHHFDGEPAPELVCNIHESTSNAEMDDWSPMVDMSGDFEWLGPLVIAPVAAAPVCADCSTPLLYECTGCSATNYPPRAPAALVDSVNYAKLYGMACEAADFAGFELRLDGDKDVLNLLPKESSPAAPGIDLRVRELVARRLRQWRTHIPSDQATPGTREIRTYDHPGLEGETDYNNDIAIWREACSVLDEVLTLIDASPKGGSDSARLDWLESKIRHYGDGHTEPREAYIGFNWQQTRPGEEFPGLRAAIDAAVQATSAEVGS